MLEAGLDRMAVDRLVQYVKKFAADKSKEPAFTNKIPEQHGEIQTFIQGDHIEKTDGADDAKLSHTFVFETFIPKWKSSRGFGIKATSQTIQVVGGQVIGLGKLNGEWIGIGISKK